MNEIKALNIRNIIWRIGEKRIKTIIWEIKEEEFRKVDNVRTLTESEIEELILDMIKRSMVRVSKARPPLFRFFSAILRPICWAIHRVLPQHIGLD